MLEFCLQYRVQFGASHGHVDVSALIGFQSSSQLSEKPIFLPLSSVALMSNKLIGETGKVGESSFGCTVKMRKVFSFRVLTSEFSLC